MTSRAAYGPPNLGTDHRTRLTPFSLSSLSYFFSLRIFGHAQSVDKGNEDIGEEEDIDDYSDSSAIDKECVFATTEEESEKMAAAVRSEGPSNLAEKLKVWNKVEGYKFYCVKDTLGFFRCCCSVSHYRPLDLLDGIYIQEMALTQ